MTDILEKRFLSSKVDRLGPLVASVAGIREVVGTVVARMVEERVNCLFVLDDRGELVGIITERDVIKKVALNEEKVLSNPVSAIMTTGPVSVRSSVSVARALYEMSLGGFRHLPITFPVIPVLRVLSVESVVDFIYSDLTKRIAEAPLSGGHSATAIEDFFRKDVGVLGPSAPIVIHEDQPVSVVVKRLQEKSIGSVMLVDGAKRLTGIFTERDYLFRVARQGLSLDQVAIKEVMTKKPKTILQSASISLALNLMSEGQFRHIPIVNHSDELVATVSARNFITFLSGQIMREISLHN